MPEPTTEEVKPIIERQPGSTSFPLARIKRIIKEDKDIASITNEATFCIAQATELFLEYFLKESHTKATQDKRKTVHYKDLASAVKETASLEFLEEVIPTTMTLKAAVEKRRHALRENTPIKKQKIETTEKTVENNEEEEVEDVQKE